VAHEGGVAALEGAPALLLGRDGHPGGRAAVRDEAPEPGEPCARGGRVELEPPRGGERPAAVPPDGLVRDADEPLVLAALPQQAGDAGLAAARLVDGGGE